MMVFVSKSSVPSGITPHFCWALNSDGEIHPKFVIDTKRHIERAIEKFESVIKAVGINPQDLMGEKSL